MVSANWEAGLFLRTPFTEGCDGVNYQTLAPWPLEYAVLLVPLRSVQFSSAIIPYQAVATVDVPARGVRLALAACVPLARNRDRLSLGLAVCCVHAHLFGGCDFMYLKKKVWRQYHAIRITLRSCSCWLRVSATCRSYCYAPVHQRYAASRKAARPARQPVHRGDRVHLCARVKRMHNLPVATAKPTVLAGRKLPVLVLQSYRTVAFEKDRSKMRLATPVSTANPRGWP